jgi:hypothetical protein
MAKVEVELDIGIIKEKKSIKKYPKNEREK